MGFQPEHAGSRKRIYSGFLPICSLIAAAMNLTMMRPAQRDGAHLATERARLHGAAELVTR
jgi:hypothetical protein